VQTASAAVIVTPANASTVVQNLHSGLHQFVWSIANADNSCISKDTVTITNSVLPNTAYAGMDDTFCVFNTILLTANNAIAGTPVHGHLFLVLILQDCYHLKILFVS
jgi:hypothetical protein